MSVRAPDRELLELRRQLATLTQENERLRRERDGAKDGIYRSLVEHAWDIPYWATPDGELAYIGPQIARYGIEPERALADGVMSFIDPEDHQRVGEDIAQTMVTGEEFNTDFRLCTPDGERRWLEDHGKLVRDGDGSPVALVGFLRDVTDQRLALEALKVSEQRFRSIAEHSIDAIFEVGLEGHVRYVSPAMATITGRNLPELLCRRFDDNVAEEETARLAESFGRVLRGETLRGVQFRILTEDRGPVTLEINAAQVAREDGETTILGVARDVTARIELEAQVREMQKMEALGTLARGVAHDFNNQLLGIIGFASLLQEISEPGDQVHEAGEVIEQAADRAAELTQQLLGFARKRKLQSRAQDMHELVDEVTALLGRTLDKRIAIVRKLEAPEHVITGDPGQLHQVLLNLGLNAGQAIEGAGTVAFETSTEIVARSSAGAPAGLGEGPHLRLTVRDTGSGIAAEHIERVFEPFFTTKPKGEGSGMGLAMAYGIVRAHGGAIRADSSPGGGSTFEVWLPLAVEVAATPQPATVTRPATGAGTVLVVDDEDVVRRTVRRMLTNLGYVVLLASDGKDGLERYQAHREEVDLVLLDLAMPVMDGHDCYHALRELDPGVRVLIASGDAMDGKFQKMATSGLPAIAKPYTLAALGDAVGRALGEGTDPQP